MHRVSNVPRSKPVSFRVIELLFRLRRKHSPLSEPSPDKVQSILLVELTRLGDALAALPGVACIREAYPHSEIHWVVRESFADLLGPANPRVIVHAVPEGSSIRSLMHALRLVRAQPWTLACSLGPGRVNGLVTLLSRATVVAGYLECNGSRTPFRRTNIVGVLDDQGTRKTSYENGRLADRSLKVCKVLGLTMTERPPMPTPELLECITKVDVDSVDKPHRSMIVLCPGAAWQYRMWLPAHWVTLGRALAENGKFDVVILGRASELDGLGRLRVLTKDTPSIRVQAASHLLDMARAIRGASLCIGCDSGSLHLATFLGVPTVGLYGPAEPELTRPAWSWQVPFHGIYHRVDCSPCDQRACVRPHSSCMSLIQPGEVIDAARAMLNGEPSRRDGPHG